VTGRLVILAPNWLGDAVMSLPAIENVRRGLPEAAIDMAARPAVAPLFTLYPRGRFERIVVLGDRSSAVRALAEGHYDAALLLPNSFNAARLVRAAGIRERWGYRADFRSLLLTRPVLAPVRLHQVDHYRHLVEALGFAGEARAPQLEVTLEQRADAAAFLAAAGWNQRAPLVAMAPGAAFGTAKRWPAASFASLADRLADDGVRTVLIGTASDRPAGAELLAASRSAQAIDLMGRTDLPMLAAALTHCRALVTNDSGAMHMAAALGVNITALIGPTRERETHPVGAGRHVVLTNPVWCRPCMLRECPLTHRCMTGITVDAVHAATRPLV